jgi:hypothetical protein
MMMPPITPSGSGSPYGYQPQHRPSGIANGLAAAGALGAVAAFFLLPYLNLGVVGTYTASQVATALDSMNRQQGQSTASTLRTLLWVGMALAAAAAGFTLWEAIRHASSDAPISPVSSGIVLAMTLVALMILVYQYVIL